MGFSVKNEFPSRFLKGEEITGKEVPVTIREVRRENVFSPQKNKKEAVLVVYFQGKEKGVILKKQRALDLKTLSGSDDTDGWIGQTFRMFTEKKKTGEGVVDVIRFKDASPDDLPPDQKKALGDQLDAKSDSSSLPA
jgi:hypothetical protein